MRHITGASILKSTPNSASTLSFPEKPDSLGVEMTNNPLATPGSESNFFKRRSSKFVFKLGKSKYDILFAKDTCTVFGRIGLFDGESTDETETSLADNPDIKTWFPNLVVSPESAFRWKWDLLMTGTLLWVSIFTPLQISYLNEIYDFTNIDEWIVLFVIERVVDTIFLVDMGVTIRTAWISDETGKIKFSQREAIALYLGSPSKGVGWFWVDFMAVFPFELVTGSSKGVARVPRMFRIIRLLKLSKVLKMVKVFVRVERHLGNIYRYGWMRIWKFAALIMMLTHWFSCMLYLVYTMRDEGDNSWLHQHSDALSNGMESHWSEIYITGLYWGMTTLTTTGYGDVTAGNAGEKIFFVTVMLIATFIFAYIVGNLCIIIDGLSARSFTFQNYMDQLNEFMDLEGVPQGLRVQARSQTYYKFENPKMYNDKLVVLSLLSENLRKNIMENSYGKYVRSIQFFSNAPVKVIAALCLHMQPRPYCPGEFVIKEGEYADALYLLVNGEMLAYVHNTSENERSAYTKLQDGDVFGYKSLLFNGTRMMTVETQTFCQTFFLRKSNFMQVLEMYPEFHKKIRVAIIKSLWKKLLTSTSLVMLSNDETFLAELKGIDKTGFGHWYMLSRNSGLARQMSALEKANKFDNTDDGFRSYSALLLGGITRQSLLAGIMLLMERTHPETKEEIAKYSRLRAAKSSRNFLE